MKRLVTFLIFVVSLFAPVAWAGSYEGIVKLIHVMGDGTVIFYTRADIVGSACPAGFQNRFAFDSTTPAGQSMLKVLLLVYTDVRPLHVQGNGVCQAPRTAEGVSYISTVD